jgi:hypothetical protein
VKIVIDVGCAAYGGDRSIERLIKLFEPDILYGFDPAWEDGMYVPEEGCKTSVVVSNEAAWIRSGSVRFLLDGLNGQVGEHDHWTLVPCFDLARFIRHIPAGDEIILKLDCEGSEYELLERLIYRAVDRRLSLAWIEWHPIGTSWPEKRRASLESRLRCQVDEWTW